MPTPPRTRPRPGSGPQATPGRPSGQRPSGRSARRSRPIARQSFLDRNRSRLIWAGVLIVALAFGGIVYLNATAPAYACSIEWTAPGTGTPASGPAATPAPASSEPSASGAGRLGFPQGDMGRDHVAVGTVVKYLYCPPASGDHYNQVPLGPIQPRVYGPNEKAVPEGWVHNLEHGALVVVYSCKSGDGCSDAAQSAFKQFYTSFPNSPRCNLPPGEVGPIIARFDDMAYPYAALVWDQILPLQAFDQAQILAFFNQQAERTNPEQQPGCAGPSASPAPIVPATAAPTTAPASDVPAASPAPVAS